jgi:hypothetical protein
VTRFLVIAWVALAAACSQPRRLDAPVPVSDAARLPHARHAQLACADCHRASARPGADDHRPCDGGACHQRDFTGAPTPLCEVCHLEITASPLTAPLKPYPVQDAWQAEPSRFSHQRHLNNQAMEERVGFHVTCVDCHTRGDVNLTRPDHAACTRCHAAEVALGDAPRMADCQRCHDPGQRPRVRRRLIQNDLQFDHARHRADRKGVTIRCEECHAQTARATGADDHAAPRVESCVACHDDSARTQAGLRMRVCETCHARLIGTVASLPPRNHLPLTDRPLDHTLSFRRDHGDAAASDATRCAACHTQMSGNPQQACDECHQTMEPADHRITWRELDHGREAAAARDRCARCHVVDFCTSCHRQRPRSHGFANAFWTDHGRSARIDPRPCTVCHGAEPNFCTGCHQSAAPAAKGKR